MREGGRGGGGREELSEIVERGRYSAGIEYECSRPGPRMTTIGTSGQSLAGSLCRHMNPGRYDLLPHAR